MSKWQPIETAPKDGFFLVCSMLENPDDYDLSCAVTWREFGKFVVAVDDDYRSVKVDIEPTHWMPLPEPPK